MSADIGSTEVVRNTGVVFSASIASSLMKLFAFLLTANFLGIAGYGFFSSTTSATYLLATVVIGGLDWVIINRFSAGTKKRWILFRNTLLIIFLATFLIISISSVFSDALNPIVPGGSVSLIWAGIFFPVFAIMRMNSSALMGLKKFKEDALAQLIVPISFLIGIGLLNTSALRSDPLGYLAAFTLAYAFGAVFQFASLQSARMKEIERGNVSIRTLEFIAMAYSSSILQTISRDGLFLYLGNLHGLNEAGKYALAATIASPILMLGDAVSVVTHSYMSSNQELAQNVVTEGVQHIIFVTVASSLLLWLIPLEAITLIVPEYVDSLSILNILWPAYGLAAAVNLLRSTAYALNRPNFEAGTSTVTTIIAFIASIIILPLYSSIGLSTLHLARFGLQIIIMFVLLREVGIRMDKKVGIKAISLLLLSLGGFLINVFFGFAFYALFIIPIFLLFTLKTGILQDELSFWLSILKSFMRKGESRNSDF